MLEIVVFSRADRTTNVPEDTMAPSRKVGCYLVWLFTGFESDASQRYVKQMCLKRCLKPPVFIKGDLCHNLTPVTVQFLYGGHVSAVYCTGLLSRVTRVYGSTLRLFPDREWNPGSLGENQEA